MDAGRDRRLAAMEEENRADRRGAAWALAFLAGCIVLGLWIGVGVYGDCRAAGIGRFARFVVAGGLR